MENRTLIGWLNNSTGVAIASTTIKGMENPNSPSKTFFLLKSGWLCDWGQEENL